MVKFGEELERAIFPLWRSYYMDYNRLKKVLEVIRETYPYMHLLEKHDMVVCNNPSKPFELEMAGAIFSFTGVDGAANRNCKLRVCLHDAHAGEGGSCSDVVFVGDTNVSDVTRSVGQGHKEADGSNRMAEESSATAVARLNRTARIHGHTLFLELDERKAALLSAEIDFSARHSGPSCLKSHSAGYTRRMREKFHKDLASLKIGKEIADSVGGMVMTLFLDGSSSAKAKPPSASPRAAPVPDPPSGSQPAGMSSVVKDLASLVGGITAEQKAEVRVKREEAQSVPKQYRLLGAALGSRPLSMDFYLPDEVTERYRNPSIAHALYCYHLEVSNVFSQALKEELEKVTNFYISQSHIICTTALLCVDAVKLWRDLTAKERSQIRTAYRQTYSTLDMLQQFCDMNCLAVAKILKKVDKRTHQQLLTDYKVAIDNLVFKMGRDSRIHRLQKSLNAAFSKHVMRGDHKQGLSYLDSRETVSSKPTELSLAVLVGIVGTMTVVVLSQLWHMNVTADLQHSIFPPGSRAEKYSILLIFTPFILVLWSFLFSINVMVWEYFGINFAFMFELDPIFHWTGLELMRDSLMYVLAWILCVYQFLLWNVHESICVASWEKGVGSDAEALTAIPTFASANWSSTVGAFNHIFHGMDVTSTVAAEDEDTTTLSPLYWIFPIFILIFVAKATFNHLFFNNRKPWMAITMWRIITTPAYRVKFSEFIICNNLASLGGWFFQMTFYWCPMAGESSDGVCNELRAKNLAVMTVLPPFSRLLQCFRRYYDQPKATRGPFPNLINAGKYTAACVAVLAWNFYYTVKYNNTFSSDQLDVIFWWVVGIQIFAQVYKYAWDIVVDAGIWIRHDDGVWRLREDKVYGVWWPYTTFCIVNVPLTSTWAIKLALSPYLKGYSWMWVVWQSLEVGRRCYWNFMRVENEHVNNTEGYRATRFAPIPAKRVVAWDAMADDLTERFLRTDKEKSSDEFPAIKGVNLSGVTKFFAQLPEGEQINILQGLLRDHKANGVVAAADVPVVMSPTAAGRRPVGTQPSVGVASTGPNGGIDGHVYYESESLAIVTTIGADGSHYATELSFATNDADGRTAVVDMRRVASFSVPKLSGGGTANATTGAATHPSHRMVPKATFFSELPEEVKTCLILEHLGPDETMNSYLKRISRKDVIVERRVNGGEGSSSKGSINANAAHDTLPKRERDDEEDADDVPLRESSPASDTPGIVSNVTSSSNQPLVQHRADTKTLQQYHVSVGAIREELPSPISSPDLTKQLRGRDCGEAASK